LVKIKEIIEAIGINIIISSNEFYVNC